MRLDKAIEIASKEALKSNMRYTLGAIIFDKFNYATGYNRAFNCCVSHKEKSYSIHAEEMAIKRATRKEMNFSHCTLIVLRINKIGDLKVSKPCETCQKLILDAGIKTVYYIDEYKDNK